MSDPERLRLVPAPSDASTSPAEPEIRSARREMARTLRALQASGRGLASWPDEVVTRLAHVDSITARFLLDRAGRDPDHALEAAAALRALRKWVLGGLPRAELSQVRRFEFMIRVDDVDLCAPLLRPDGSPEEAGLVVACQGPQPCSLRVGLRDLEGDELDSVARRLGVRPLQLEAEPGVRITRPALEEGIIRTLRDDHLLAILVATLPIESHELLAALVRNALTEPVIARLAEDAAGLTAAGGGFMPVLSPAEQLRGCGLVFRAKSGQSARLWVPIELHRRLDGMLRTFGL